MRLVVVLGMFINYLEENVDSEIAIPWMEAGRIAALATIIEALLEEHFLGMWIENHLHQNHLEMVSLTKRQNSEESRILVGGAI